MNKQVISWGHSLDRKQGRVWRDIGRRAFRNDPHYFPSFRFPAGEVEKEFFVLSIDGEYVGRAATTTNASSITHQPQDTTFIDDFAICDGYQDDADLLLGQCLSSLKEREVRQVIPRLSDVIPAIQTEGYEHCPPFGCPHNPPWYVEIFLKNGFHQTDEWIFLNSELPPVSENKAREIEQDFEHLGIKLRPLNIKNPREFREFQLLGRETNPTYSRFNPIPNGKISRLTTLAYHILSGLFRARVFVGIDAQDKMVLGMSHMPELNWAIKRSNINWTRRRLSNIYPLLRLPFTIRRVKACRELGIGLKVPLSSSSSYFPSYWKTCHELGIVPQGETSGGEDIKLENLLIYWGYLMRQDGYEELVALVQMSSLSMPYWQSVIAKYENVTPVAKCATLVYNF